MKLLTFCGSPRENGNTFRIIEKIAGDATARECEHINLNKSNIKGCQACMYCRTHDACLVHDDMDDFIRKIKNADAVIFGSPVYMSHLTAQSLTFTDRLFTLTGKTEKIAKPLVLVITHGAKSTTAYETLTRQTEQMFALLGFKIIETVIAGGMSATDAHLQPDIISKAEKTALRLSAILEN